jgi:hypothetical protein
VKRELQKKEKTVRPGAVISKLKISEVRIFSVLVVYYLVKLKIISVEAKVYHFGAKELNNRLKAVNEKLNRECHCQYIIKFVL